MNLQNGFSTLLICLFTVILSPAQGVDEGIEHIIDRFKNPSPNYILVVSHRGIGAMRLKTPLLPFSDVST